MCLVALKNLLDKHTSVHLTCINPDDRLADRCDTDAKMPPQNGNWSVGNTAFSYITWLNVTGSHKN